MEAQSARRVREAFKAIETVLAVVSWGLVVLLGLLCYTGVLVELWVVALPAVQLLALKLAIGGYYGARVAPRVINEAKDGTQPS